MASKKVPHPEKAAKRPSRSLMLRSAQMGASRSTHDGRPSASSPLVREIAYGDPAALFAPFAGQPGSMLLDSPGSGAGPGRHAFIAVEPFRWMESKDGAISLDGRPSAGN